MPGHSKPDVGRVYPIAAPQTNDEFDAQQPGLQWQWQANYEGTWLSLAARKGWLRLQAEPVAANNLWAAASIFLQKLPAPEFTVTSKIDFSNLGSRAKAGLIVMGADYSNVAVERVASGFRLAKYSCQNAPEGKAETREAESSLSGTTALLRVKVSRGPVCDFSFSSDGQTFSPIGARFRASAGKWIGAKVGLFCLGDRDRTAGYADFDWVRFER